MSDSSDDDVTGFISPSSIRPSMRRDVGMGSARQSSTIVKAAARRQLRGDSDKKPVKEVAADLRKKMQTSKAGGSSMDLSNDRSPSNSRSMMSEAPMTPFVTNGSHVQGQHERQVTITRAGLVAGGTPASGNVGIGIKFTEDRGQHIVTSLLPDGPADLTRQIFQGDIMQAVDGLPLSGLTSKDVIDLILGPPGSDLVLTLSGAAENLSQRFQQTPIAPANHTYDESFDSGLRSKDSPSSKEFELVTPGQTGDCSVGLMLMMDTAGRVKVKQVIQGTSAAECMRIHAEDLLVRVDGVDIAGKEAHAIEKLIMGPFGSPVSLTLESAKNMERISVRLTRKEPVSGHFVVQAQTPAPQEATTTSSRRPDEQSTSSLRQESAATVSLEKFQALEQKLDVMEKALAKLDGQLANKSEPNLSKQISDFQSSLNRKLEAQESQMSKLSKKVGELEKKGCSCVIS